MDILIIEDEIFLQKILKENLEEEGYNIHTAITGEDALHFLTIKIPNLILLDLLLPQKNGFSLLEEIKQSERWKTIPIIVISNLGDAEHIEQAKKFGIESYLIKSDHSIMEVLLEVKRVLSKNK